MDQLEPTEPPRKSLATPADLAQFLQVQETTLANWRWRRIGPPWFKTGRHVRYSWEDIETWLANKGQDSTRSAVA